MRAVPRSYLFVPGHRPERFDKAMAARADALIIDLEDAVPAADKPTARSAVERWLHAERPVLLRINGADTEWFDDDHALCRRPGVAGVVLPKAESPQQILRVLSQVPNTFVLPLIESACGIANVESVAATSGVQRLVFGSIDFQLDMGIWGDGEELLLFRSRLVLASRLAGIAAPVDGVTTMLDAPELTRSDAQRARRLGFGAKLCIHPKQVDLVNSAFTPSEEELAWARRVVDATRRSGGAPVALDGAMIDWPVMVRAQVILGTR